VSDDGACGSKNDVPGAQSLHTCGRVLPYCSLHAGVRGCASTDRFSRAEGPTRDVAWIQVSVHACAKAHISKLLAETHMIFEC
jgi:hypothetical protein